MTWLLRHDVLLTNVALTLWGLVMIAAVPVTLWLCAA